jgi:DNA-binding NtrC family response regulator
LAVILVAEDDRDFSELIVGVFEDAGHEVDRAIDGAEAIGMIHARKYDLVLCDVKLPVKDGMEVLQEVKQRSADTEVIIMTAYGTVETAGMSMKLGASDYLQKPFSIPELQMRAEKALKQSSLAKEVAYLRHTQDVIYRVQDIIGQSSAIREVLQQLMAYTNDTAPVLITGEPGTGRQLIAGAIHYNSSRKQNGFIRVSCTVGNRDHLESDLFGHIKGAYPAAKNTRVGRIEQANGGTITIEEIAEAPLDLQIRILEFIKTGKFRRFGGSRDVSVDVRVIAITSRDLKEETQAGHFVPELLEVLSVHAMEVPPLRQRKEDIELLAAYFIERLRLELEDTRPRGLTREALEKLSSYDWPGNIREMKNVLERALFTAEGDLLEPSDIQLPGERLDTSRAGLTDRKLKELEKQAVIEALEKTDYVQKDAAKLLGISKRVIHYKVQQFGIKHPRWIKNR